MYMEKNYKLKYNVIDYEDLEVKQLKKQYPLNDLDRIVFVRRKQNNLASI